MRNGNQIYIHFDGYPESVIPILNSFFKLNGAKFRMNDNSYLSAWFVTYYCMSFKLRYLQKPDNIDYYDYKDYFIPSIEGMENARDFSGIGLHNGEESDTNYTYIITNNYINFNVWIYGGDHKFIDLITL